MEFPRTAVIHAEDKEDAEILCQFLHENGYIFEGGGSLLEDCRWNYADGGTCYDIEEAKKFVNCCDKKYYENNFAEDYPQLFPDTPEWFLCSVNNFILMCGGTPKPPAFEPAGINEISKFLGI